MSNRPPSRGNNPAKRKGDVFERAVLDVFRRNGFPWAQRTRAGYERDYGDLHPLPGRAIIIQAKNRARLNWVEWFRELDQQRRNAGADHAILVVKRPGIGSAEDALAVMRLVDMIHLLRAAGYGHPSEAGGSDTQPPGTPNGLA